MNRILTFVLLLLCGVAVWGQEASKGASGAASSLGNSGTKAAIEKGLTYDRVLRSNFWNEGSNVAGLRQDSVSISNAEIFGRFTDGSLRQSYEGGNVWTAGVDARTIMHLSKLSMIGSFGFEMMDGRKMCGSMMISPGSYPIDILEFTPGHKTRQRYGFDGGIAYDVAPSWRIGGRLEFQANNYAKRKDLRYTNYRLDLKASVGAMWHRDDLAFGWSLGFLRDYESIKGEQIGTKGDSYYAFLDKGLMFGAYEVWTSDGVHLDESGVNLLAIKENAYSVAFQAQIRDFWAEIGYICGKGSTGEKQNIWCNFPSQGAWAHLGASFGQHCVRLKFDWKSLGTNENVLDKVTEGGVTTVHYYASNRIYNRAAYSLAPEYEYVCRRFEIRAAGGVDLMNETSSQRYPYVFKRNSALWHADVSGLVRIWRLDLLARLGYAGGDWKERKYSVEQGLAPAEPFRHEEYYAKQKAYETCDRISAGLGVKYDIWKGLYVGADALYVHGFGGEAFKAVFDAAPLRWTVGLRVGLSF